MRTYDVLFDFGEFPGESGGDDAFAPDAISTSPYAVMAVWRYRNPSTFSRQKTASFSTNVNDATDLRDKVLVVVDDMFQISIQHTKASHVSQMNCVLHAGMNYLSEIFPGDWVAAWIVNDEHAMLDLVTRIRKGEACNHFYDGLKFLGKAASIRKKISVGASGHRSTSYTMNAAGFTELDTQTYYEPYLADKTVGIGTQWLRKTGTILNKFMDENKSGIAINKAMPLFLDAFYGTGTPKNQLLGGDGTNSSTATLDNPNAFVVPDQVASMLGVTKGTKPNGKKSWNDICEVVLGIQTYKGQEAVGKEVITGLQNGKTYAAGMGPERLFTPDGISNDSDQRRRVTNSPMLGRFSPSMPQFSGQRTVWSILEQYLNPAVNEMYTSLRVNPAGQVFPTFTVRQLPFSSGILSDQYVPRAVKVANEADSETPEDGSGDDTPPLEHNSPRTLTLTRFLDIPRWKIHPILIRNVDLGRSDATRWNFIHIYGDNGQDNQRRSNYITRDPPVKDDLDIARTGLRPYMATVNCDVTDAENRKAGDWMYIMSDILMGQHMLLTGSIETVGIVSPICPGDNVEFDEHVLHIESVSHSFQISGDGSKSFKTALHVSHGVKANQIDGRDLSMYTGTSQKDLARFDYGTSEYQLGTQKASNPESVDTGFSDLIDASKDTA